MGVSDYCAEECKAKNFQKNKKGLLHKQKANSEELFV